MVCALAVPTWPGLGFGRNNCGAQGDCIRLVLGRIHSPALQHLRMVEHTTDITLHLTWWRLGPARYCEACVRVANSHIGMDCEVRVQATSLGMAT